MKICKKLLKEIAQRGRFELGDNPIKSIHKNAWKVDWFAVSHEKLNEAFIREFQDKINWSRIGYTQSLSEDFIREFQDRLDWDYISYCQILSEDFIREFQDKVNWYNIFCRQFLSEEFVKEFKSRNHWNAYRFARYENL
jgi:hypothetical protein